MELVLALPIASKRFDLSLIRNLLNGNFLEEHGDGEHGIDHWVIHQPFHAPDVEVDETEDLVHGNAVPVMLAVM